MGKINWGRVVSGGLLAGVVLNIIDWLTYGVWLKADMAGAMQALGKQPSAMDSAIPLWVALDFVSGIGLLWVYAAIRPRFGAGAKTAVIAEVPDTERQVHLAGPVAQFGVDQRFRAISLTIVGTVARLRGRKLTKVRRARERMEATHRVLRRPRRAPIRTLVSDRDIGHRINYSGLTRALEDRGQGIEAGDPVLRPVDARRQVECTGAHRGDTQVGRG